MRVVIDELAEHVLEAATVQDDEPVEAFSADGADEALGDRIRLWRAHQRLDHVDVFAGEDGIEVARLLGVAISDQEAETRRLLLELDRSSIPTIPGSSATSLSTKNSSTSCSRALIPAHLPS